MTIYAYGYFVSQANTVAILAGSDQVVVGANGFVVATAQTTFDATGAGNIYFSIAGTVSSYYTAINIASCNVVNLTITPTGFLDGYNPLRISGTNVSFTNFGTVFGQNPIYLGLSGTGHSTFLNAGGMNFQKQAFELGYTNSQGFWFHNSGTILAQSGTAILAYDNSVAADKVINSGTIIGDIMLGGGNDIYIGRGGTVDGTIFGGVGDDTFRPGLEEETIDGGAGNDFLTFRSGGAIEIALDGSFENTGLAAGDTYLGIENVTGSARGADVIVGTSAANRLTGLDGADSLSGLAGVDSLMGGLGADVLTGGLGNDNFQYNRPVECGDRILDFSNISGDDDRIFISAAGFGNVVPIGVLSAALFQIRADNAAQDSDDRFIFRTTDTTLWFDADGNGTSGPIMVADLQAGATFTASDILVF